MISDRVVRFSMTDKDAFYKVLDVYYPTASATERGCSEHVHPQLEISVITSASGVYTCSGVDYDFSAGDVFMHCGNDVHHFKRIDPGPQLSLLVFQFEPRLVMSLSKEWFDSKYLQMFMKQSGLRRCVPHDEETAQEIYHLMRESVDECREQGKIYDLLVKSKLFSILTLLARYFYDDLENMPYTINQQSIQLVQQSIDFILSHLEDNLTLNDLAMQANMSRSYYSTVFRTVNGIPLWTYITHHRIQRAKKLLHEEQVPITDVALRCGFNTIANFNRAFKNNTGMTPSMYRRCLSANAPSADGLTSIPSRGGSPDTFAPGPRRFGEPDGAP